MQIAVPKEIKNNEYRVAITPPGVHELTRRGHRVSVERGAGTGSSISDDEYAEAGATIVRSAEDAWQSGELVLKVKEPIEQEYDRMQDGQVLFTYLHLAAAEGLTKELLSRGVTAIAYETVQTDAGALPLLAPMSEVAGKLAVQVGAYHLMRAGGGRGVLLGGVPGVKAAKVVVIGAGTSGINAADVALGMQAQVVVLDTDIGKLRAADRIHQGRVQTIASNAYHVAEALKDADLVIGAVLLAGAKAPMVVPHELVGSMRPGSVLVDIAIDQGGCFEDSHPTTHEDPTFPVEQSVFYCVANMPGAVPNTSTYALTNVTLPYAVAIAEHGWRDALGRDPVLARGLNTHAGKLTNGPVAEAHGLEHTPVEDALR